MVVDAFQLFQGAGGEQGGEVDAAVGFGVEAGFDCGGKKSSGTIT